MISANFSGRSKGAFNRPACVDAERNGCGLNMNERSPFGYGFGKSPESHVMIGGFISCLFKPCRPLTIIRFVSSTIILAVNRMFRTRTRPHIFKKCLEAVRPTLANGYSLCPIMLIRLFIWVQASSLYSGPHFVFVGFCKTVLSRRYTDFFISKTSTTNALVFLQISGKNSPLRPAIATTQPIAFTQVCEHRPTIEFLSDKIFNIKMRHSYFPLVLKDQWILYKNQNRSQVCS